jgi:hypothetical protein
LKISLCCHEHWFFSQTYLSILASICQAYLFPLFSHCLWAMIIFCSKSALHLFISNQLHLPALHETCLC